MFKSLYETFKLEPITVAKTTGPLNLNKEIKNIQDEIDKKQKEVDELKSELNHKYSEQAKVELELNKKKNTIDKLKSEINDGKYTFWIFNFRNKSTDVSELESELNNVYKEVDALEKDMKNKQEEIDSLKSSIDKKQKEVDELNRRYSEQAKVESKLNQSTDAEKNANKPIEVNNKLTEKDYIKWAAKNDYIKSSEIKGVYFHINDIFKTYPVTNYSGNIADLNILSSDPSERISGDIILQNQSWVEINGPYDVWLYRDKNFKGNCVYIHNGKKNRTEKAIDIYARLQGSVSSVIVKPAAIIDGKLIDVVDYDMGKLRDYMGRTVSIISLGNQNFAIDDTGVQKANTGYHIWTFTANNLNQQFKINSYGQLVRVGTKLCLYYEGGNTLIQKEAKGSDRKSLWCLDDKDRLIPLSDQNKAIDISSARYENGVKLIVHSKNEELNQKWKLVSIEGFSSLFVGSYNSTLTLIKLIGGLLIIFCFFKLMMATKYDAVQRRREIFSHDV